MTQARGTERPAPSNPRERKMQSLPMRPGRGLWRRASQATASPGETERNHGGRPKNRSHPNKAFIKKRKQKAN